MKQFVFSEKDYRDIGVAIAQVIIDRGIELCYDTVNIDFIDRDGELFYIEARSAISVATKTGSPATYFTPEEPTSYKAYGEIFAEVFDDEGEPCTYKNIDQKTILYYVTSTLCGYVE